jgi:hypothetical protein
MPKINNIENQGIIFNLDDYKSDKPEYRVEKTDAAKEKNNFVEHNDNKENPEVVSKNITRNIRGKDYDISVKYFVKENLVKAFILEWEVYFKVIGNNDIQIDKVNSYGKKKMDEDFALAVESAVNELVKKYYKEYC